MRWLPPPRLCWLAGGMALAAVIVISVAFIGPREASAQTGGAWQCQATIDGVSLDEYRDYRNALNVRSDDELHVAFVVLSAGGAPLPATIPGRVAVSAGPISVDVASFDASGGAWLDAPPVVVRDHLDAVGLYRVAVTAGDCGSVVGWVKVSGAHPLTTPFGVAAAVVGVAGVAGILLAVLRGLRARGLVSGLVLAVVGGLLVGLSGCVLSQQFGTQPLSWDSWTQWSVPPVGFGAVVNVGASIFGRRRDTGYGSGYGTDSDVVMDGASEGSDGSEGWWGGGRAVPPAPTSSAPPAPPAPVPAPLPSAEDEPSSMSPSAGSPPDATLDDGTTAAPVATYTAHGLLDCPPVVIAGETFILEVGLAPERVTGVTGEAFELPSPVRESYELLVELDTPGFVIGDGGSPRRTLTISQANRYPTVRVPLVPASVQGAGPNIRGVRALFVLGGSVVGYAKRHVTVVATEADLDATDVPTGEEPGMVAIPPQRAVADLTVVIEEDEEVRGRLRWTLTSPHVSLPPGAPQVTDIGDAPEQFARQLVDGVGAREGSPGLSAYLRGVGNTIAEELPPGFWSMLDSVAAHARAEGRAPTIFLLVEEPHVPWELAAVEPRIDPEAPPFLGAQACVGRWVLGTRRPKLPPPTEVTISSIAVVSGEYALPGWSRLLEAEAEAADLRSLYGAVPVNALASDVLNCLGGEPPAELLHFAMHGIYDPNSTLNGLVLADGQTIDPLQIRGQAFSTPPFVFLNACQVGSSQRVLGDYAGLAEAFLFSGAAGVLAPLWSIKDTIARQIALRFYERSFAGAAPAEIMRQERAAFGDGNDTLSATSLAYLFYGHPSLLLRRTGLLRTTGGIDDA